MTTFAERWREHLRLAILLLLTEARAETLLRLVLLLLLAEAPGRSATASLLIDGAGDFGLTPTRDQVETALAWLAEQGAVTLTHEDGVTGAAILSRGLDVVAGRADPPGVAPLPTYLWVQTRLAAISLQASIEDVEAETGWLLMRSLVTFRGDAGLLFATRDGRDTALGRRHVDGVKVASPETVMRAAASAASNMLRGG